MCLAVPMQVIGIDGLVAECDAKGVRREVNLYLLQDQAIDRGDFLLVHVGYAIQKLDSNQARQTLFLLDQIE